MGWYSIFIVFEFGLLLFGGVVVSVSIVYSRFLVGWVVQRSDYSHFLSSDPRALDMLVGLS